MKMDIGCESLEHHMWMGVTPYHRWFSHNSAGEPTKTYSRFIEELHMILKEVIDGNDSHPSHQDKDQL